MPRGDLPSRVLTLAIEASNPNVPTPGVLLARSGEAPSPGNAEILATSGLKQQDRHDDLLLPAISEVIKVAGVSPAELDEILVSIGPGGFTATRLACTAAAVLAEVSGARLLTVSTVHVAIETELQERLHKKGLVVAMAGKQDTAYLARFDASLGLFSERGVVVGPGGLDTLLLPGDALIHDAFLPTSMLEIASQRGHECIPLRLTVEGLLACRSSAGVVLPESLRPIYPREPDAVTQWRRRYGKAPGDA